MCLRGKFNITGGDNFGRCEERKFVCTVTNCEWLPRQSCLNVVFAQELPSMLRVAV